MTADFACSPHRIERTRNNLRGAGAIGGIRGFRFEQFRVRQDDAELIIQPVEQHAQVW